MRKELEIIEQIENYLLNKMSDQEMTQFEAEINRNPELADQVQFHQEFTSGFKRAAAFNSAQRAYSNWKLKILLTKGLILLVILGAIAISVVILSDSIEVSKDEINKEQESSPSTIYLDENDSLFASANQYLEQQLFKLSNDSDTVIETNNGLVVFVPAGAFDTPNDQIDFIVQEALNPADIMYSGLNTMTKDGDTLETGGMFYFDAFSVGERVKLNKELIVDVPADPSKTGMQLYDGEKDANGEIVWKDPKPLSSPLIPLEITELDFYPPGYEKWMDNKGFINKDFKDSLYFSFAFTKKTSGVTNSNFIPGGPEILMNSNSVQEVELSAIMPFNMMLPRIPQDTSFGDNRSCFEKGKALFEANCGSCHLPDRDMTGPSLKGAKERWKSNDLFYLYIQNSQASRFTNNKYVNELRKKWGGSLMTPQAVTFEQINDIFCYVENYQSGDEVEGASIMGVDPAVVQTIWNKKFNNTNLATKEFEMRMPYIHNSCNTAILEVYISNLDKSLSEVDLIAYKMGGGSKFKEFAAMNHGKVDISSAAQKELIAYYQKKSEIIREATRRTNEAYWTEQRIKDLKMSKENSDAIEREIQSKNSTYQKELNYNIDKVYLELGIKKNQTRNNFPISVTRSRIDSSVVQVTQTRTPIQSTRPIFRANINNLGWKNIDCLYSISRSRESVRIKNNNKTTKIDYLSWQLIVTDAEQFNRINVYNIPKEFNTYVKISGTKGKYNYTLNSRLSYKTVVIAWNENGIFYSFDSATTPGEKIVKLESISATEWSKIVNEEISSINAMSDELNYIELSQKDLKRQNINQFKKKLLKEVQPVIFPCWVDKSLVVTDSTVTRNNLLEETISE
ncbi:MAG: cytochrome c [Crocinitomicaceae bacterium]|nr:cytochrome c [Crocinitomicaceae bacterium]